MTNLTRGAGGGGKLARIDGAKIFALIEKRSATCVDESNPDVSQQPIPGERQQSATPICSPILYLRKSVAALKISADKKIAYMLLDSVVGKPGHLGCLYDINDQRALANRMERRFGPSAAGYWREKYCGTGARSATNTKRLIAGLRDLISVNYRGAKPASYHLQHTAKNDVLACPLHWLMPFFEGKRSALEILTLMVLYNHDGPLGCFPCQQTLMKEISTSRSSIQRALRSVESDLLLKRILREGRRGRRHNSYILKDDYRKPARSVLTPSAMQARSLLTPDNQKHSENQERESVRKSSGVVNIEQCRPPILLFNESRKAPAWREWLTPIRQALEEHALVNRTLHELHEDRWLAQQFLQMTNGETLAIRSVAAFIAKESLRRFSRAPDDRKRPWPNRFGYWLTATRAYLAGSLIAGRTGHPYRNIRAEPEGSPEHHDDSPGARRIRLAYGSRTR